MNFLEKLFYNLNLIGQMILRIITEYSTTPDGIIFLIFIISFLYFRKNRKTVFFTYVAVNLLILSYALYDPFFIFLSFILLLQQPYATDRKDKRYVAIAYKTNENILFKVAVLLLFALSIKNYISSDTYILGETLRPINLSIEKRKAKKEIKASKPQWTVPFVIDLDGDGLEIEAIESGAHFDLDRNGFAEKIAWVSKDDGILVLDKNKDGIINDGGELLGSDTAITNSPSPSNGFKVLATLDVNNDKIINFKDPVFLEILVWQDVNCDGFSQPEELKTLKETGISSISLKNKVINRNITARNTIVREGKYTRVDGSSSKVGEFALERDTFITKENAMRENPDDIADELLENLDVAFLPNFKGYGTVHSLKYAMLHDVELKVLVKNFSTEKDRNARRDILWEILLKWTGNEGVVANSRGKNIDAQKLAVLESFMGKPFVGVDGSNPNSAAANLLNTAYDDLFNNIYYTLLMQEQLAVVQFLLGNTQEGYDFSGVQKYIDNLLAKDQAAGINFYKELTGAAKIFGWESEQSYIDMKRYLCTKYDSITNL